MRTEWRGVSSRGRREISFLLVSRAGSNIETKQKYVGKIPIVVRAFSEP